MRVRNITTCALGLAAALTLAASSMAAQDPSDTTRLKTTSQKRINISKGEVAARVDTVYQTRIDTVRVNNTIVRVDTVTIATPAPIVLPKIKGPMYWGLFGGASRPYGNVDRAYTNGFHAGGLVGWEQQNGFLGLRLDGLVNQLGREETLTGAGGGYTSLQVGSGTPLWMALSGDLKVKPISMGGWDLYAIAGVNFNRYKGIAITSSNSKGPCDFAIRGECFQNASTKWSNNLGFNFGLGTDFHIGSQDMFVEYRGSAMRSHHSNTWVNPISIGVRYF
jgi:hypothetical protein